MINNIEMHYLIVSIKHVSVSFELGEQLNFALNRFASTNDCFRFGRFRFPQVPGYEMQGRP